MIRLVCTTGLNHADVYCTINVVIAVHSKAARTGTQRTHIVLCAGILVIAGLLVECQHTSDIRTAFVGCTGIAVSTLHILRRMYASIFRVTRICRTIMLICTFQNDPGFTYPSQA